MRTCYIEYEDKNGNVHEITFYSNELESILARLASQECTIIRQDCDPAPEDEE